MENHRKLLDRARALYQLRRTTAEAAAAAAPGVEAMMPETAGEKLLTLEAKCSAENGRVP